MNPRTALAWLSFLGLGCGGGDDEAASSDGGAGGTPSAAGSGGAGGAGGAAGSSGAGATAGSGGGLPGGAGGTVDAGAMGGAGGAPFVDVLVPPPDYSEAASWLCLPGAPNDVCAEELDATVVAADGTTTTEVHTPMADPAIDCFYVYPTISLDMSGNSDLEAGKEEVDIVQQQAARLTSVCRMYAPLYRQVTVASLFGTITPERTRDEMRETAYADVLASFTHYLENDNDGRGFVLIGHSQGAGLLRRVVQEEIDDDASIRDRMVAAYIVGSAVAVPDGADVGGDFQNIAACRSESQTGCVVSYATYAETAPPPDDSLFGAPRDAAGAALCVNPAAPAGGAAPLSPYWKTDGGLLDVSALDTTEPYVTFPGLLEGQCVRRNGFDVLEVTVNADPSDPRPDELDGRLAPNWGLHLIDLHLTMGDVVDLVQSQAAAYAAP